nr:hypothetical protein Iba_chr05dCG8590 [Ipomoea batatas]
MHKSGLLQVLAQVWAASSACTIDSTSCNLVFSSRCLEGSGINLHPFEFFHVLPVAQSKNCFSYTTHSIYKSQ